MSKYKYDKRGNSKPRRNLNGWEVLLIMFCLVLGLSFCDVPETVDLESTQNPTIRQTQPYSTRVEGRM